MSKYEAYLECQKRGHQPSNVTLTMDPPMQICEWCGTHYRYTEPTLVESNLPHNPDEEVEDYPDCVCPEKGRHGWNSNCPVHGAETTGHA